MSRIIATTNEILRGVVGSTAHGTGLEGQEDRDEMGVFIEPPENVCGLTTIDHYLWRTQPEGTRSTPGDLDLVMYSLRKFCRLAVKGNPSVLMLLWLQDYLVKTTLGQRLIDLRDNFISWEAGSRYLGYLSSQKKGLLGERSPKVSRPELIAQFGYDTKYAMHALRLGLQGIELLTHHHLSIPISEPARTLLTTIRKGELPLAEVLRLITEAEDTLRHLVQIEVREVDRRVIDRFLVDAHLHYWERMELNAILMDVKDKP